MLYVSNPDPENIRASVNDIRGRKVIDNIQLSANGVTDLSIGHLPAGTYVLDMVLPAGYSIHKKFIKTE